MHGTGMFDNPGVFYSNNPTVIFDNNWLLDQSKIASLKQHKLSVLDFSSEHYGVDGLDYVYNALEDAGINFLLLTHDPSDHLKFPRMLFYSHWYNWGKENFIIAPNSSCTRTYKWSCLNGNPRAHRIYNYFYSRQQSYFNSAYFTFYNADISRHDDVSLPSVVTDFWENTRGLLPSRRFDGPRCDSRCDLPANTNSYIHLVTETTILAKIFISEKTWKPIASEQLFLIFGNPGTISHLRNCGIDVFDDIVDHSYDLIDNWDMRLHAIHDQLKHLLTQDLKDIYIATQQRRADNAKLFFSGTVDNQYKQTLKQCINTLS